STDLRASLRPHDVADGQEVFRDCGERVLAAIHRRRARVVGEAGGDAFPPLEAYDSAYHPDLNLALLENRSLLDMQLEDRGERPRRNARVGQMRGILSIASQPVGHGLPVVILAVENFRSQHARAATPGPKALVRE